MTIVNNTYATCEHCGQYINRETTDHVVCQEFGKELHLHLNPCYRQFNEIHDTECESIIRKHQHLS